jgi:hypothetical protein
MTRTGPEQGAIVPNAETNGRRIRAIGMAPNVADDGKFASVAFAGFGGRRLHLLRIGQIATAEPENGMQVSRIAGTAGVNLSPDLTIYLVAGSTI